jgi:hypothetical protein
MLENQVDDKVSYTTCPQDAIKGRHYPEVFVYLRSENIDRRSGEDTPCNVDQVVARGIGPS